MMQPTIRAKQSKLRGYRAASRDRQGFEGLNLLGFQLLQNRFLGVVLVDRPACVVKAGGIGPHIRAMGFLRAWREHLHRCFIGVDDLLPEHYVAQRIDQRLQLHASNANPLGQS